MLTRLRLKNWRSIKDETIEFTTPITVFIGANASGKTNILDALHFLRHSHQNGLMSAIYRWQGRDKILTIGIESNELVQIDFTIGSRNPVEALTQHLEFQFLDEYKPVRYGRELFAETELIYESERLQLPLPDNWISPLRVFTKGERFDEGQGLNQYMTAYVSRRWQILEEGFLPQASIPANSDPGNLYFIAPDAGNMLFLLDLLSKSFPALYDELHNDLLWLLNYVEKIEIQRQGSEIRLSITERFSKEAEAPTVSAGTRRLIAMLLPFYMLDMNAEPFKNTVGTIPEQLLTPYSEMPGLVVIEEPDTALNPGLLRRFVELLRGYVEDKPRQIILTTHNPAFLDYFEPDEVRVVERDENGYTRVHTIPESTREIWLDKYTLGEVWRTRSLGGVPE